MNKAATTVRGVQRARARKARAKEMKRATSRAAKVHELNMLIDSGTKDERVAASRSKKEMTMQAWTTVPGLSDLRGPKDWVPFGSR